MTDTRTRVEIIKEKLEEEQKAVDAITDPREQALASAEFRSRVALHQNSTHENVRNWKAADKARKEYREEQTAANSGERFKNIEQAAAWIIGQGYIVSARSVRNHTDKPGFPRKQKDGSYLKEEIATYAVTNWDNPSKLTIDIPLNAAGRDELIAEQVRKLRLANEITEGNYILRSLVEQEFSARASFLKRDLFNLGPRFVDRMVDKLSTLLKECGVPVEEINIHALVPDMEAYWDLKVAEHLHEYSKARGFIPEPITPVTE